MSKHSTILKIKPNEESFNVIVRFDYVKEDSVISISSVLRTFDDGATEILPYLTDEYIDALEVKCLNEMVSADRVSDLIRDGNGSFGYRD